MEKVALALGSNLGDPKNMSLELKKKEKRLFKKNVSDWKTAKVSLGNFRNTARSGDLCRHVWKERDINHFHSLLRPRKFFFLSLQWFSLKWTLSAVFRGVPFLQAFLQKIFAHLWWHVILETWTSVSFHIKKKKSLPAAGISLRCQKSRWKNSQQMMFFHWSLGGVKF